MIEYAGSIECDACEQNCMMDVESYDPPAGGERRFFVVCDKPQDMGCIWLDSRQLERVADREQSAKKGGIAAIFGKWPGDETDEQIERALQEMG